jgi:hypothetical protein
MHPRRDIVDIPGLAQPTAAPAQAARSAADDSGPTAPRPWLGIFFRCCGVYSRIYRSPDSDRYVGNCPRCAAEVRARVGQGGTSQRIFHAE